MVWLHAKSPQDNYDEVSPETLLILTQSLSADSHTCPILEKTVRPQSSLYVKWWRGCQKGHTLCWFCFLHSLVPSSNNSKVGVLGGMDLSVGGLYKPALALSTHQCCTLAGVKINLDKLGLCHLLKWEVMGVAVTGKVCTEGRKHIGLSVQG